MAEWIVTIIAIGGVICSIIGFGIALGTIRKANEMEHKAIFKSVADLEHVIGNGNGTGLRYDIQNMKLACSGEMANVKSDIKQNSLRISAHQHEIDDIKKEL